MSRILDGRAVARMLKSELRERVSRLARHGMRPGLGTILVGDDPASKIYVAGKHRDCASVGVRSVQIELPRDAQPADVLAAVSRMNGDPDVTGFIVQLPLPRRVDPRVVLEAVDPAKDADGLHPCNLGRLALGYSRYDAIDYPLPCTPCGILELLRRNGVRMTGKLVTVVGSGVTVGRPLGLILTLKGIDATVTVTHSRTIDVAAECRRADVVVAAAGSPYLIKPDWVKPGAIVLDVGITRSTDPQTGRDVAVGDVDPATENVAGWISPNPGGVGPMTRVELVQNVVSMAERQVQACNEN